MGPCQVFFFFLHKYFYRFLFCYLTNRSQQHVYILHTCCWCLDTGDWTAVDICAGAQCLSVSGEPSRSGKMWSWGCSMPLLWRSSCFCKPWSLFTNSVIKTWWRWGWKAYHHHRRIFIMKDMMECVNSVVTECCQPYKTWGPFFAQFLLFKFFYIALLYMIFLDICICIQTNCMQCV